MSGSHNPIIGGNKTGKVVCRYGIDLALAYQVSVSVALAVCYPIAEQSLARLGKMSYHENCAIISEMLEPVVMRLSLSQESVNARREQ